MKKPAQNPTAGRYTAPAHVDPAPLRHQADRRRAALTAHGCATYTIGLRGTVPAIACLCCGLGSSHAQDIAQRYCGFCHQYHSEWRDPAPEPPQ